jgi:hypothetical protein
MASIWKENQLVQTKKMSLKESSWFGEPKCKLGSKVVHLFIYCYFPPYYFKLVAQIMWEWKKCYGLKTLLRAQKLPHFDQKLTWLVLWILTRLLLEGVHIQPFQMHEMKVNQKVGQKVEGWSTNFHKWKGIWICKRS